MKKMYVFGNLNDCWTAWFYYGTEKACKKWLKGEGVPLDEIDDWVDKAFIFVQDNRVLQ